MPYRKINISDYIGKKYGRLTIVGRSLIDGKKGKGSIWDCVCDCGNKIQVSGGHLYGPYRGKTRSCGCLHDENSRRFRAPGESGVLKVFNDYIRNAKNRRIEFKLTLDVFKEVTSKNCIYCGSPPNQRANVPNCSSGFSSYYYNGIDRIDSLKGYLDGNVVPCCFPCNIMKWNLSRSDFLKRIAIIYKRHENEINLLHVQTCGGIKFEHDKAPPELELYMKKISETRNDSIFYAERNIARVRLLNKDYILTTSGGYRFIYKDSMGKKHHGNDFSSVLKKWTDKDLQELELNNCKRGWGQFSIVAWTRTDKEKSNMKIHPVGNTYDEAMKAFIDFVKTDTKTDNLTESFKETKTPRRMWHKPL